MHSLELLSRLARKLRKTEGIKEVDKGEGYYPEVDTYLEIVIEPLT